MIKKNITLHTDGEISKVTTLPPNRDNVNGDIISIQVTGIRENGNLYWRLKSC